MRLIRHPGAEAPERADVLPCRAVPVQMTLLKGLTLTQAIHDAMDAAGFRYGYLRLDGVELAPLTYVMPAPAPGDGHAAWYSATQSYGQERIIHGGAHLGLRDGKAFVHCHAIFARGEMGHVLCDDSLIAQDATIEGWGLLGAGLVAQEDAETHFTLFRPHPAAPQGEGALLITLRPNQDITTALEAIAMAHGIDHANIEGIGSLVGTSFMNSWHIDSYATEILLVKGHLQNGNAELLLASVGFDGPPQQGILIRNQNAICVTAEILLVDLSRAYRNDPDLGQALDDADL